MTLRTKDAWIALLPWAFALCFVLGGLLAQLAGDVAPWEERAPIEYFTGGLLWMLALVCLLAALAPDRATRAQLFWTTGCVVLSVLAIDEAMGGHEWAQHHWGIADEVPKVILWLATPAILRAVYRGAGPWPMLKGIFVAGYAVHTLYLVFEVSDGRVYDTRGLLTRDEARWGEEVCELVFLAAYWLGFVQLYLRLSGRRAAAAEPARERAR